MQNWCSRERAPQAYCYVGTYEFSDKLTSKVYLLGTLVWNVDDISLNTNSILCETKNLTPHKSKFGI